MSVLVRERKRREKREEESGKNVQESSRKIEVRRARGVVKQEKRKERKERYQRSHFH